MIKKTEREVLEVPGWEGQSMRGYIYEGTLFAGTVIIANIQVDSNNE